MTFALLIAGSLLVALSYVIPDPGGYYLALAAMPILALTLGLATRGLFRALIR